MSFISRAQLAACRLTNLVDLTDECFVIHDDTGLGDDSDFEDGVGGFTNSWDTGDRHPCFLDEPKWGATTDANSGRVTNVQYQTLFLPHDVVAGVNDRVRMSNGEKLRIEGIAATTDPVTMGFYVRRVD